MKQALVAASVVLSLAAFASAQEKHPYEEAKAQLEKTLAGWKTQYANNPDVLIADHVLADRKARRVTLLACRTTASEDDPVEFFVTPYVSGKDYESVAITHAKPSDVHKALEFIGLKPGRPVNYETNHQWPRGPRVRMTFEIKGQQVPAEDLIINSETKASLARTGLVFTGSQTVTDEQGKKHYAADVAESRSIAPNFNDPVAVLDVPHRASQGEVYGFQRHNPKHALPGGTVMPITFAPIEGDAAVTIRDIRVHAMVKEGQSQFELREGETVLAAAGSLPALVEAIGKQVDGKSDLFTTFAIDPALPVAEVRKLYGVLTAVEKDRGVKIDPPTDGSFFHRAFFPDEQWRSREDRLGEPWELFLTRADGKLSGRLERVIDNPDADTDQKQVLQRHEVKSPDEVLKLVTDNQSQWTKALFVFPPNDLTYGEALAWAKQVLPVCPRVFFFPPAPTTTQPTTAPAAP